MAGETATKKNSKQQGLMHPPPVPSSRASASPNGKPLKKMSTLISFGFSALSSATPASTSSSTASSKQATKNSLKRKVEVIELEDSDVDSDDSVQEVASLKPGSSSKIKPSNSSSGEKGKGVARFEEDVSEDEIPRVSNLWTDMFQPKTTADLAVHKRKISDVKEWLVEALDLSENPNAQTHTLKKYRRILILSGPAGTGKTATVRALSRELGFEIVEWLEGSAESSWSTWGEAGRDNPLSSISSFLSRHAYPSLQMPNSPSSAASSSSSSSSVKPVTYKKKILLLEELPYLHSSDLKKAFTDLLLDFAQSTTVSSSEQKSPLIIIVSDRGQSGRAEESFMTSTNLSGDGSWREAVGKEVGDGPYTRIIPFNPIAPTIMTKALNSIIAEAFKSVPITKSKSKSKKSFVPSTKPSTEAVEVIVHNSNGDIRSAINALQFLSKSQIDESISSSQPELKGRKTGKGSRGGKGGKKGGKEMRALLEAMTRREQSLALFHALGRVLYNKRVGDPTDDDTDETPLSPIEQIALPDHLLDFKRRESRVNILSLFGDTPVDNSLFNLYLHQNYPGFSTEIDECFAAADSFSYSDSMRTDDDIWQSSATAIEYGFNLTVRGLLMGLPTPVPRNGQKMFKPEWFERLKKMRQNEERLNDVGAWCAGNGIGMASGGQLSRFALASDVIPLLHKLPTPLKLRQSSASVGVLKFVESGHLEILNDKDVAGPDEEQDLVVADENGMDPGLGRLALEDDDNEQEAISFLLDDDIDDF